uniref:Phosphodiesterase n=1 Tax=Percolomonas cosmopolitus TaxID=63605 RepID=A0A7S1KNC7_9EUKA|eukprot:CAMPEP_0117435138 /NCGR_PEP_ID=MMETSP0759-20121206/321_1 /TAXON_ID=63605 /ORGANISM="Percolomonas cosmopolitus, Strain WS" /LENGTH=492 /DNA_ID=CAMNT_0005226665 /DNA_START=35 /DNA_END=1513 /DNA_ORIENTATION=+
MTRALVSPSSLLPVCPSPSNTQYNTGGLQSTVSGEQQHKTQRKASIGTILNSLDFDAFEYTYTELRELCTQIFENSVLPHFALNRKKLDVLVLKTQAIYQHVPYHSFRHSIDVTQFVYYCTQNEEVRQFLTPLDTFIVIVTALLHDLAHCGVNNPLLAEIDHDLATKYPESPLEEFHAELAARLIQQTECAVLEALPTNERTYFLQSMQKLILATDMSHHFSIKAEMEKRVAEGLSPDSQEDRFLVMKLLLKCADLSNVARSFETAREWAKRVVEEFSVIGDLQKEARQQATTETQEIQKLFDRERLDFPESQVGFINFVAKGQFSILSAAFSSLDHILQQVNHNADTWQQCQKQKDQHVLSFEQNLRALGGVIREPIDGALHKADIIKKPLEELSAELQETETSLIQRRLRAQQQNASTEKQVMNQNPQYVTSTSDKTKKSDSETSSTNGGGQEKKKNGSNRSSSSFPRIVVLILGAACCFTLFFWGGKRD